MIDFDAQCDGLRRENERLREVALRRLYLIRYLTGCLLAIVLVELIIVVVEWAR